MRHIKSALIISLTILFAGLAVSALGAGRAYADPFSSSKDDACQGVSLDGSNECNDPSSDTLSTLIKNAINILSIIIGIAAVIMVLIGGFRYVISAGDAAGTNSAKNTILYALVGLAIAVLAQALVHFVLNKISATAPAAPANSSSTTTTTTTTATTPAATAN